MQGQMESLEERAGTSWSKPSHLSSVLPRQPLCWGESQGGDFFFLHLIKEVKLCSLGALKLASRNISFHLTTLAIHYPPKQEPGSDSRIQVFLDQ